MCQANRLYRLQVLSLSRIPLHTCRVGCVIIYIMEKLFIYIPTYNRPKVLRKQLLSLLPQVEEFPHNVRVLVCDNASEKYDENIIPSDFSHLSNVSVRRNAGNIGGNANISLGFIFAQPDEFLWILSDNDLIQQNAVHFILSILSQDIDFYAFAANIEDMQTIEISWQRDGWLKPINEWGTGLISAILYNMNTISDSISNAFYFHNSSFPHIAVACSAAKKRKEVKFILGPISLIISEDMSPHEQQGNYSLSLVGMPLLVPLFSSREARTFCNIWVRRHGFQFYANRAKYPHIFLQTKATILHYGGLSSRFLLVCQPLLVIALLPFRIIISILKRKLSVEQILYLKKISRR